MPTRGVRPTGRGRAPAPVPPPSLVGHARASTRIGNQVQSGTPGRSPVAHLQLGAQDLGAGTSLQVGVCSLVGQARAPTGCADESGGARPGRCPATPESGGAAESDGCPGSRSPVGECCFVPRRPGSAPARQKNKREAFASLRSLRPVLLSDVFEVATVKWKALMLECLVAV